MLKYLWIIVLSGLIVSCKNDKQKDNQAAKTSKTAIKEEKAASNSVSNNLSSQAQQKTQTSEIRKVSIIEAKKLATQGYTFVDIRTPKEIERGKIDGALEMNLQGFDFQHNVNKMERDIKLIVYCSAGKRSALANKLFSTLGFTNVVEMPGGYSEWRTNENK